MNNAQRPLSTSLAPIKCRIVRSPLTSEANNLQSGDNISSGKHRLHRLSRGSSPNPDNVSLQLSK